MKITNEFNQGKTAELETCYGDAYVQEVDGFLEIISNGICVGVLDGCIDDYKEEYLILEIEDLIWNYIHQ